MSFAFPYAVSKSIHLILFSLLFVLIALGATQALVGYSLRRRGNDPYKITNSLIEDDDERPMSVATAIVMPICNENVGRVIDGLRVIYKSVDRTGRLPESHFFILSDSTDPNCWIEEEAAWLALIRRLGAQGRIFYRKRRMGINKKSGNLADFCRRWGKLYRYMVVLDADSIMTGKAIVRLVQLMECNRRVGIIQGVPLLAHGRTILARLQQFASRLYGPISTAGLNYWQLSEANYWGHNAIIRLAPFIQHCSLPPLPGDGPFGGLILSHDYVEAALMRRAGWQVWLTTELDGSYEECPSTVVELAQRDRRWLQGNLQHARLVVARGFHAANRVHFILGILAYVASPLWLALLVVSIEIAANLITTGFALRAVSSFATYIHWSYQGEALCLFAYTMVLLFLPKILSLMDLRSRAGDVAWFGGWRALFASVLLETIIFTLIAPILMIFHTWFTLTTLLGHRVSWGTQHRAGADSSWDESVVAHGALTIIGIVGAFVAFWTNPHLLLWMSPVLIGLIFSIPLSYIVSSPRLGVTLQRLKLFQTAEESNPMPELVQIAQAQANREESTQPLPRELRENYGLLQAVLDPYVNAVHVSLLREKDEPPPKTKEWFSHLREILIRDGPQALEPRDRIALLLDADSMHALHNELWFTPSSRLAEWWRLALQHYVGLAPAPQTAFSQ